MGLCLICTLFSQFCRRSAPELTTLLGVAAILCGILFLVKPGERAVEFARELTVLSGLPQEIFLPVLKAAAIAVTVKFCSALCRDAGESALSVLAEIAGAAAALIVSLPLFEAVLSLLEEYI